MILEFKIDGMTCVSCSQTIEGAMKAEFEPLGLKSVVIALLTHKMRMVFDLEEFTANRVDPERIVEEVSMVGFTAELLDAIENNQEILLRKQNSSDFASDNK